MKLRYLTVLGIAALAFAGCNGGSKNNKSADESAETKKENMEVKTEQKLAFCPDSVAEEPVFDIVTNMGTIRIKLYKDTPQHRDNFVKLASERFFDGILFHRVIKDFMIQAGDPYSKDTTMRSRWGQGGPGYTIPAEIVGTHTHKKGALAAARKGDTSNPMKESSGSQFYIVSSPENCAHLDGAYTIFGETLSGLNVVDAISNVPVGAKDVPQTPVVIERVELVKE